MKTFSTHRLFLFFAFIGMMALLGNFQSERVYAEQRMDLETHNSLIEKLESVLQGQDINDVSPDEMIRAPQLYYRLADLYAERARLLAIDENGKGDKVHKKEITKDRQRAIRIYDSLLPSLRSKEQGHILLQTAQLYALMDKPEQSERIYKAMVAKGSYYDPVSLSLSKIQLGDILFFRGNFSDSRKLFLDSTQIPQNPRMGYAYFRASWCLFNQGETKKAQRELEDVLKKPNLLEKSTVSGRGKDKKVDISFQDEASHDLATFMATNDLRGGSDIDLLSRLTPESSRRSNLVYLAKELARTGKKQSAILVWKKLEQRDDLPFEDQLEGKIQMARIQYDLERYQKALVSLDQAIVLLQSSACKDNQECTMGQQSLRKIIVDWGKGQERKPTAEMLSAVRKFTKAFGDYELSSWAGQMALKRKDYREAFGFFVVAANGISGLSDEEDEKEKDPKKKKSVLLEGALLGAIDASERQKDINMRWEAYNLYIKLNPSGAKRAEVLYQLAKLTYDKKDYSSAYDKFQKLAMEEKSVSKDIREKSGDLALDTLVILKRDKQLESDSLALSKAIPSKRGEYLAIWRKAILNQTAQLLSSHSGNSDTSDGSSSLFKSELDKLENLELSSWPSDQRIKVLLNQLSLAYQIKDIDRVEKSTESLMKQKGLSSEQKEMVLSHLEWSKEMKMNFSGALLVLKKISPPSGASEKAKYFFKRALLAELSHNGPTSEYLEYLKWSSQGRRGREDQLGGAFAAHRLVILSGSPMSTLKKYEKILKSNLELYAASVVYAVERSSKGQSKNADQVVQLLGSRGVSGTFVGQLVARSSWMGNFEKIYQPLKNNKFSLRVKNPSLMQKNMQARLQLLDSMEKMVQVVVHKKDALLQIESLPLVAEENRKFADEILASPIPKGLNEVQRKTYMDQLNAQVQPYVLKADQIKDKIVDLWKEVEGQEGFKNISYTALRNSAPGVYFAKQEIQRLKKITALLNLSGDAFEKYSEERQKVSQQALEIQKSLETDPFNSNDLQKLKGLRSDLGDGPFVAYLEARLAAGKGLGETEKGIKEARRGE